MEANSWLKSSVTTFGSKKRENLKPLDMPQLCDGCGKRLTVDHALSCKCGGLVHIRHGDVGKEWESLSVCAFSQGAVLHEPYMYGANRHTHENATTRATTPPNPLINTPTPQQPKQPPQPRQQPKQPPTTLDEQPTPDIDKMR